MDDFCKTVKQDVEATSYRYLSHPVFYYLDLFIGYPMAVYHYKNIGNQNEWLTDAGKEIDLENQTVKSIFSKYIEEVEE